jgi:prepilin-type N-terminal cleavage/methylation domain-containing protein
MTALPTSHSGITLVELMIVIAVLSVLAGIAVPIYNSYIREGHLTAMRSEMVKLRVPIEEFRLENGDYTTAGPPNLATYISETLDELNAGSYSYNVVNVTSNSYDVTGSYAGGALWARCDDRLRDCCDAESTGSATPVACP